ncbi:MAG: hypothetical protein LUF89_11650 [Ruminococcus sp.]|nr:hypothetical protein [Ruminococcus sp.]
MKAFLKSCYALLLAGCLTVSFVGCSDTDTAETSAAEDSDDSSTSTYTDEAAVETESNYYTLIYNSEKVPDDMATTIETYFFAILDQDYDLYQEQIYGPYLDAMEAQLQEDYGYGMETELEQYHQALIDYAGTEDFTITSLQLDPAEEALADNYDEDTDFISDYLDAYADYLGDDFIAEVEEDTNGIYDICMVMKGEDADGNEITILDSLEILVVEDADGNFGIFG